MAVTTLLIADLRAVNKEIKHSKLVSSMNILNQNWNPKDIMPPFIQVISNLFAANVMKKPKIGKPKVSIK